MSFEEDIKNWLTGRASPRPLEHLGRSIKLQPHVSGITITLYDDWESISFSTGEPRKAFRDAAKHFESNKIRLLKEKLNQSIKRLEEKEKEVQEEKEKINKIKKFIKDKTLSTFESTNNV
jgi:hypothetical protein